MKLTAGAREVASSATWTYFEKGSRFSLAYSQLPNRMGQMLTMFFPNREKPTISPAVTSAMPLKGSPQAHSSPAVISPTAPALTRAAPGPPMAI